MTTNLAAPRACTAIATVILCSTTALPTIATAADRGLGTDEGHDSSRYDAAGGFHDGSGYSAESLLRLGQGSEGKQHPRGQSNEEYKETVSISQWHG